MSGGNHKAGAFNLTWFLDHAGAQVTNCNLKTCFSAPSEMILILSSSINVRTFLKKGGSRRPLNCCHLNLTAVWESSGNCNTLTFTSRHPLAASCIFILSGRPGLWVSTTQYPAAKLLGVLPCSSGTTWTCRFVLFLHCAPGVTPPSVIKLRGVLCNLSVGTVRVQMTNATPSLPPAVHSLRLDPDNHLPSVARHCNALPHGLITATLFQL